MNLLNQIKNSINKGSENPNPYYKKLYRFLNRMSLAVFIIGLIAFFYIFIIEQNLFEALAVILIFSWITVFIRYFGWALYFYNINYGWTDQDWKSYKEALEAKKEGKYVDKAELKRPNKNPYRSQSFGLPSGTVRGMLAFTLLFGAMSMLLASLGKEGYIDSNSFFWNHFEFFETAFLMMIAFYFGDKSLRYLQSRSNAAREKNWLEAQKKLNKQGNKTSLNDLENDDLEYEESERIIREAEDSSKSNLTSSMTSAKKFISNSESRPNPTGLIPIIDAGHGGIDTKTGNYVTAPSKMYDFQDPSGNALFSIYEGEINRKIARYLIQLLDEHGIEYHEQTVFSEMDISLEDRVKYANGIYQENRNTYFLSIHSNAAGVVSPGPGSKATGFELYTSVGQTKSDELADIAAKWYKQEFPDFKFRQDMLDGDEDKEANFYVLSKTACPALLVENLFFDNIKEAEFLLSDSGQMRIAVCLLKSIKEINETQTNGILA
ncbi:MAG: N-acetylmuramoyl-L-alanine amidase [Bacteroidota bacterium]